MILMKSNKVWNAPINTDVANHNVSQGIRAKVKYVLDVSRSSFVIWNHGTNEQFQSPKTWRIWQTHIIHLDDWHYQRNHQRTPSAAGESSMIYNAMLVRASSSSIAIGIRMAQYPRHFIIQLQPVLPYLLPLKKLNLFCPTALLQQSKNSDSAPKRQCHFAMKRYFPRTHLVCS